jgi:alpha-L-fucosidase
LGYYTQKDDVLYLTVFNRPVNNIARIAVPKQATAVPISAIILGSTGALEVKHSDIGLDLDKNTYYDVVIPKDFRSDRAFVIKIQLGNPKSKSEKLMDAKM